MTGKKYATIHLSPDDILPTIEQELIEMWHNGQLAAPASPFAAAGALAMRALLFINGVKTFPNPPPQPSQAEFTRMLTYIVEQYHLSPAFPCSDEELKEDMATKIREIERKLREAWFPTRSKPQNLPP